MKKAGTALKKNTTNQPSQEKCANMLKAPHEHIHAVNCGHKSYVHNGHVCYEHDGHYHYMHGDHAHECSGPFKQATTTRAPQNASHSRNTSPANNKNNVFPIKTPGGRKS